MSPTLRRLGITLTILVAVLAAFFWSLAGPPASAQQPDPPGEASAKPSDQIRVGRQISPSASQSKKGQLISYAEPQDPLVYRIGQEHAGKDASPADIEAAGKQFLKEWRKTAYHGPDPAKYDRLLKNEAQSLKTGKSVGELGLAVTGTLRLLTVMVEFAGSDPVVNLSHPVSVDDRTCVTSTTTFSGPLHNQIPHPGPRDNNTLWRSSFGRDYYEKLVFSTEGITDRVRLDLRDPEDGQPGIDISGLTMRNYYNEVSGARVQFDGGPKGAIGWVQVPHSEAYYGASICRNGVAGPIQSMEGLPSNPRFGNGPQQLMVDIVSAINAADPTFPWADYDTDGNGIIDHVVVFHAGIDKSDGGGQQRFQALWAHRGTVDPSDGGYTVTTSGPPIKLLGYTLQYENAGAGVLVHEFGHDLGHPDLYDTSGEAESSVVWWDLMSTGSHPGKIFSSNPTHMSAWTKTALGWASPQVVAPTAVSREITLGQTSNPPPGSTQAVRVNLPDQIIQYVELEPGSTQAWWTNNDQAWADVRLTRDVNLASVTAPISISFDLDFVIEEDWDYLFLEVSADGGQSWTQAKGFLVADGTEVTTPDDYDDPNGRLSDYGGLKHGYTGDSGGWLRVYHDLSLYAGQPIKLRFRYATDAALQERGAFMDNIKITAGAQVILNDPVEGNNLNGWTPTVTTFVTGEALGAGWRPSTGAEAYPQYYLLEWRNLNGFDTGLKYTYNTVFSRLMENGADEWRVDKVVSNVPGMVVWLRDTRYGTDPMNVDNNITNAASTSSQLLNTPSEGAKGGLLVVDANFQPLRGPRGGALETAAGVYPYPPLNNWSGRVQATNAAFSLLSTPPLTLTVASRVDTPASTIFTPTVYGPLASVAGFHDALGYYPGVETLPVPVTTFSSTTSAPFLRIKKYALSDPDASAVVPASDYYPPRTPAGFTGIGGETSPPASNVSRFETLFVTDSGAQVLNVGEVIGRNLAGQFSGNPGDAGVQLGYHFKVVRQAANGTTGTVRLWKADEAGDVSGAIEGRSPVLGPIRVSATAVNLGAPITLTLVSDFDESQGAYVEGSATNGATPVRDTPGGPVKAVQRTIHVGSGQSLTFNYLMTPNTGVTSLTVHNRLYGPASTTQPLDEATVTADLHGSTLFLPLIMRRK